jgi:hypothetical protein
MAPTENLWFNIHEVSPESAFSSEITKVPYGTISRYSRLNTAACNPFFFSIG